MTPCDSGRTAGDRECKPTGGLLQAARGFVCKKIAESQDGGVSAEKLRSQINTLMRIQGVSSLSGPYRVVRAAFNAGRNLQEVADSRTPRLQDETGAVLAGGSA